MTASIPVIESDACVHTHAPFATCDTCVASCPVGALTLDDEGLSLDSQRCVGCGLCVPACPRAAIDLKRDVQTIYDERGQGTVWAACVFSAYDDGTNAACVHRLGTREFDAMADAGITTVHILTADCDTCAYALTTQNIVTAAKRHGIIRSSQGLSKTTLVVHMPASFADAFARAKRRHSGVDRGRRSLLMSWLTADRRSLAQPPESPLTYDAPVIDSQRCTACDSCIHFCPDNALQRHAGPPSHYTLSPTACTGCGLCVDACDKSAISLQQMAAAHETHITLDSGRCTTCGAPYDWIAATGRKGGAMCHICAKSAHRQRLFQVIETP